MTPVPPTILVVDDDEGLLFLIQSALGAENWSAVMKSSGLAALAWLEKHTPDLLLLDLKLKDIDGRGFISALSERGRNIPFIIVTGQGDERVAVEMMKRGALDYLVKDINFVEFVPTVVRRALDRLASEKKLAAAESEVLESRALTQAVLNSLAANIAVLDRDGRIIAVNRPWEKFAGDREAPSFVRTGPGINYLEMCRRAAESGESGARDIMTGIGSVLSLGETHFSTEYPCHSERKQQWFSMTVTPLTRSEGGAVVTHTDITPRKQAEELLREADEFGKQVIGGAQAGIIVCDKAGHLVVWNPFMEQITGHPSKEVMGHPVMEIFRLPRQQDLEKLLQRALAGEVFEAADIPFDHLETGRRCWTTARFAPWRDAQQKIVGVIIAVRDITERRRLEAELLEISDREQQRIGQDLHDGLGQQLTGLEMKNFLLVEDLSGIPDLNSSRAELLAQAQRMSTALQECVTQTRALARGLAPVNIQAGGLVGALRQLAHNVKVPGVIDCRFICRNAVTVDNPQAEAQLYRITQEAVNNALKHAAAKSIHITISEGNGVLRLSIKDDGRGLSRQIKSGMGLDVMKHRAHVIGGSLEIESKPGKGVKIICALPVKTS